MTWKGKTAIIVGSIVTAGLLVFIVKQQMELAERQEAMKNSVVQMKELQDKTMRAQSKYASKGEVEDLIGEYGVKLDSLKDDLDSLRAEIVAISRVEVQTPGRDATDVESTNTVERKDEPEEEIDPENDPHGYLTNTQELDLNEPMNTEEPVPWGKVGFKAWKEKPWNLKVFPRKYSVSTVLSTNEEGRKFVHNKFHVEVNGEEYTVPISESSFNQVFPSPEFRFSPNLYLGVDFGVHLPNTKGEIMPNMQLSLFSIGKTVKEPDWTFLGIGLGYESNENTVGAVFSPVNYNLGRDLPMVDNLHVGPSVSVDPEGNFGIYGGVRVGL